MMRLSTDKKGKLNPTFNEFVEWSAWHVMSSIVRGYALKSTMHEIIMTCRHIEKFRED